MQVGKEDSVAAQQPTRETITARLRAPDPPASKVRSGDLVKRFHFESMTVGEFFDALSDLHESGRITPEESMELIATFPPPMVPGATNEQIRAMPACISYDWLREVESFARPVGRIEEADRHGRVLALLQRLDGAVWRLDVKA